MTDNKPIYGRRTKPGPTLPNRWHICERCGIEYWTRSTITYCFDCRPMVRAR